MKPWYKSKTMWAGLAMLVAPFAAQAVDIIKSTQGVPSWAVSLLGLIVVLLRVVTKVPITKGS